jgi:hypothetical protein
VQKAWLGVTPPSSRMPLEAGFQVSVQISPGVRNRPCGSYNTHLRRTANQHDNQRQLNNLGHLADDAFEVLDKLGASLLERPILVDGQAAAFWIAKYKVADPDA